MFKTKHHLSFPVKQKENLKMNRSARFGSTYTKIGTIQRRLAWPLRKDDMQIREAFHIFKQRYRPMEQNRGTGGNTTYLQPYNL